MEHKNHKLSEVAVTFFYEDDANRQWDLAIYSDLLQLMKRKGYTAEQREAVIMTASDSSEAQTESEQPAGATLLFTSSDNCRAMWIGPNFTSFHALASYTSWQEFWERFITPTRAVCNSTIPRSIERSAAMVYVNQLQLTQSEQLVDFFTTGLSAEVFGAGPEVESVSKHLFRPEPHLDLRIHTQMKNHLIEGHKTVRLEIGASSRQKLGTAPKSGEVLAFEAHNCAKMAFEKIAKEEFVALIS